MTVTHVNDILNTMKQKPSASAHVQQQQQMITFPPSLPMLHFPLSPLPVTNDHFVQPTISPNQTNHCTHNNMVSPPCQFGHNNHVSNGCNAGYASQFGHDVRSFDHSGPGSFNYHVCNSQLRYPADYTFGFVDENKCNSAPQVILDYDFKPDVGNSCSVPMCVEQSNVNLNMSTSSFMNYDFDMDFQCDATDYNNYGQ